MRFRIVFIYKEQCLTHIAMPYSFCVTLVREIHILHDIAIIGIASPNSVLIESALQLYLHLKRLYHENYRASIATKVMLMSVRELGMLGSYLPFRRLDILDLGFLKPELSKERCYDPRCHLQA